jgi:hypothetical protein
MGGIVMPIHPLAAAHRLLVVLLTALLGAALLTVTPPLTAPAEAAAGPTMRRSEVIARADYWFRASNGLIDGTTFGRNINGSAPEAWGTARYRTDCSGMVSMAWRVTAQPGSSAMMGTAYTARIDWTQLKPGDVLITDGHVTMFEKWGTTVNSPTRNYWAYDFGGGGIGNTGHADGQMEHKQYTVVNHGTYLTRNGDDRHYQAYRGLNVVDDPIGVFDSAVVSGTSVKVTGWAFSPASPTASTPVTISVNDVATAASTGVARSDVVTAYGLPSTAKPGFAPSLAAPAGASRVCVSLPMDHASVSLGCKDITRAATTLATGLLYQPVTPTRQKDVTITGGTTVTWDLSNTTAVKAVSATLTAVGPTGNGYLTAWQCGTRPDTSTLNYMSGAVRAMQAIIPMDAAGQICVYSSATTRVLLDVNGWMRNDGTGQRFNPLAARRADTRTGVFGGRLSAGQTLTIPMAGYSGIPAMTAAGAPKALALNVTAVTPAAAGFLTVWDCSATRPGTSTLNYAAGEVISSSINAAMSGTGNVCVYSLAAVDVIVDVQGWYGATGKSYRTIEPLRVLDTRATNPTRSGGRNGSAAPANTIVRFDIGGAFGLAAAGAAAVNTTVVGQAGPGFVLDWDCAATAPSVSHLNYATVVVNNSAQVALNAAGEMCARPSSSTHVIVDVAGLWV